MFRSCFKLSAYGFVVFELNLRLVYVDEDRLAQWHNFLKLTGGTLDFGKLAMNHVDLTMIDASQDPWFDLDLVNY